MEYIKKVIQQIKRKRKLKEMDRNWYMNGGSCWGLYPPSFYATHAQEEIEDIMKADYERLKELISKLD